jgi:xanthine dehydrogenase accessory factor
MEGNENDSILQELLTTRQSREAVALVTVIRTQGSVPRHAGSKMLVYDDGRISGTIGGGEMEARVIAEAGASLRDGQTRIVPYSLVNPQRGDPGVCGGSVEVYVEPHLPQATLFVIGCGHVGRALAALGHWLGYIVVANDDRAEMVTQEQIPDADVYLPGTIGEALTQYPLDRHTYVAVVTRNVGLDRQILPSLLKTPVPYIGVIGSRRRWEETKRLLHADGIPVEDLARVRSPLGLELNAESPAEIAVSIMGEIIMLRRGGDGRPMSEVSEHTDEHHSIRN